MIPRDGEEKNYIENNGVLTLFYAKLYITQLYYINSSKIIGL